MIPDRIVRAAYDAAGAHELTLDDMEAALEAAAPFIRAEALREHANAVVTHRVNAAPAFFEGMKFAALLAMDHASHIEEER